MIKCIKVSVDSVKSLGMPLKHISWRVQPNVHIRYDVMKDFRQT